MTILKIALLVFLRIAFFGALRLALYAYVLSLPGSEPGKVGPKEAGQNGGAASAPGTASLSPPLRS
ncbi:MAG: hypothetical protein J2P49_00505 [Methylocapsa sp.]|nr:hypothetical protein [Methylocapsa sp.]